MSCTHYKAIPFFSNINLQLSPLFIRPSINYFRHISNHLTNRLLAHAHCHCNSCILLSYAVHLFCVLQHCLTNEFYCAIMLMFNQFTVHRNIAGIVTGLQSVLLSNSHPVSARNKEIPLPNVVTGSWAHPASYSVRYNMLSVWD